MATVKPKPIVLHIGDPVKWNLDLYNQFAEDFTVIRPSTEERQRDEFMKGLKENRWGKFSAIFRPFWNTGGEMGRWDSELIPLIPESCRIFASAGAGFDWADVDLLADRDIVYCNSATATTESVSDFAIFLILATFRNLTWCNFQSYLRSYITSTNTNRCTQSARSGAASFQDCHTNAAAMSHNPRGHTLGIVGLGNIGYNIARKAFLAFGMKILYYDIVRKTQSQEAAIEAQFFTDLDNMLALSDCVVLATPASPDGRKFLDRQRLSKFKEKSRFVNIARGILVDEQALAEAVESGKLVGVGLDVHEHEPRVNERLKASRNVTLTSHNAGGTLETHIGFEELAMKNIDAVLKGKEPLTPVNKHLIGKVKHTL
ncbi:putative d-mandelate protein [Botrytis fragariae]|uniref:Putative d-mandelate protein n=1 Tax=Botrytis fragariae TaxID=1964551 RepID=A0A8H6EKQ6_9HELO|nr:putative d-mandelate protein [Botrytis fragariae]KAF5875823.1 putative d-mandelate protein [Botrytis fragariae]